MEPADGGLSRCCPPNPCLGIMSELLNTPLKQVVYRIILEFTHYLYGKFHFSMEASFHITVCFAYIKRMCIYKEDLI